MDHLGPNDPCRETIDDRSSDGREPGWIEGIDLPNSGAEVALRARIRGRAEAPTAVVERALERPRTCGAGALRFLQGKVAHGRATAAKRPNSRP